MQIGPGRALFVVLPLLFIAAPVAGQTGTVIQGRIEDASSNVPIAGATILTPDSSSAVVTDSLGQFTVEIADGEPLSLRVEQLGYHTEQFHLPEEARAGMIVLLLDPAAIELRGIDVVAESAESALLQRLQGRRNAHSGSVIAYDRARLERVSTIGTVWDFVQRQIPGLFTCGSWSGICVSGGFRSLRSNAGQYYNPLGLFRPPERQVSVCVDGRDSLGAASELASLDINSVELVEIYDRSSGVRAPTIRVYTALYIAESARRGIFVAPTLEWGRPARAPSGRC